MKFFTFLFCAFLLIVKSYGQNDSLENTSRRWIALHVANGVNIIQNEALQKSFETKGIFYWGFGFRIWDPENPTIAFDADYNFSSFRQSKTFNNVQRENLLRLNQLIPGISLQLFELQNSSVRTKAGYILAFLGTK